MVKKESLLSQKVERPHLGKRLTEIQHEKWLPSRRVLVVKEGRRLNQSQNGERREEGQETECGALHK